MLENHDWNVHKTSAARCPDIVFVKVLWMKKGRRRVEKPNNLPPKRRLSVVSVCVLIAALLSEEMASAVQVCQNKRAREDYWNGGLALPDMKRKNSGLTLTQDSDLMALLDEIDNLDPYNNNPEDTDAVNELNVVIKAQEDEIGLEAQAENKSESPEEKGSPDQMGSYKQGELTADGSNSEATSACEIGDMTYYYNVPAELGFFAEHIYPNELGIIINNYIDGDSMADIMALDAVHGYPEITEDFYGSLWDNDIWQLNEHSVIQNDFESPQKVEVRFVVSETEFHDLSNDISSIQRLSEIRENCNVLKKINCIVLQVQNSFSCFCK